VTFEAEEFVTFCLARNLPCGSEARAFFAAEAGKQKNGAMAQGRRFLNRGWEAILHCGTSREQNVIIEIDRQRRIIFLFHRCRCENIKQYSI
jgi:hypothetical protein